jgi:hypothetical protein
VNLLLASKKMRCASILFTISASKRQVNKNTQIKWLYIDIYVITTRLYYEVAAIIQNWRPPNVRSCHTSMDMLATNSKIRNIYVIVGNSYTSKGGRILLSCSML